MNNLITLAKHNGWKLILDSTFDGPPLYTILSPQNNVGAESKDRDRIITAWNKATGDSIV